jgi:hypothetical protein
MTDELAVSRLKETLTPMLLLGVNEVMGDVLSFMEDALPKLNAEASDKLPASVMPLYVMGMKHFKEQMTNRLQTMLIERDFEEAVAALPPSPPSNG